MQSIFTQDILERGESSQEKERSSSASSDKIDIAIWDQDIPRETQAAIDRLLEFMIAKNISPRIEVKGNLVGSVISTMEGFMRLFPEHMHDDVKSLFDYLITWVTQYSRETGLKQARMSLKLKAPKEAPSHNGEGS